ncbi:uncharacterized protein LOC143055600 [Mytilus galloprovincialis]|uniref:uncharacterized protein LOC143055600 n=1 Tax=Mytilus galloprovincialis TaxID=29158 RepID=UPI003F7C09F8
MRDCHAILYLDNLVRLSVHADPDPGKNRTSQICTLPITIKGLPKDSRIVETWHEKDCTGGDDCPCFERKQLDKDDHNLLFNCTKDEQIALYRLNVQTSFGPAMQIPNIEKLIEDCSQYLDMSFQIADKESSDITIDDLNKSLQAIFLHEEQFACQNESEDEDNAMEKSMNDLDISMMSVLLQDHLEQEEEDFLPTLSDSYESDNEKDVYLAEDEYLAELLPEDEFMDGIKPLDISFEEPDISTISNITQTPMKVTEMETVQSPSVEKKPVDQNNILALSDETNLELYELDEVSLKFQKFKVPPLLCKHPTPAQGRDDDIAHLKEILLDILLKLGRYPGTFFKDRILFAPDHKIAKNLLTLLNKDPVFRQFLPEFPVLHLKKSKITNLFSGYKDAGILHLMKYMKDTDKEADLVDLLSSNIETAARYIKRLALAIHLAFFLKFVSTLTKQEANNLIQDIKSTDLNNLRTQWYDRLSSFMAKGRENNATFALHDDLMQHCEEVFGISIAERMGGSSGYNLLLGCVKSSLPFSFLNGATSYASFCTDLLHVHYTAGTFHQNMKQSLFSTPHKDSDVNFALDTQREMEMDHQDASKGFRPRSTIDSVIPRMAIVDHFTDVQSARRGLNTSQLNTTAINEEEEDISFISSSDEQKQLNFNITEKDLKFIVPVAKLILRVGALSLEKDSIPRNVYGQTKRILSDAFSDKESYSAGKYMVKKYACQQKLFNLSTDDLPDLTTVKGPASLLQRLKTSKGVTIRRANIKTKILSEAQKKEVKRTAFVKRQKTIADCISSEMNTCQAIVNPDCSKSTIQKSPSIKRALQKVLSLCIPCIEQHKLEEYLASNDIILLNVTEIPAKIQQNIKYATVEFAGVKFKTTATSGDEYLSHVENGIVKRFLNANNFPNLQRIVICEEKYSFTPDDFKAATRQKRQTISSSTISHLKIG